MSTNERNIELVGRYQAARAAGDAREERRSAEAIVRENEGLVKTFGFRYGKPQTDADKDDVLQAAKMGLLRAARDFDPSRGTFSTHAAWHIRDYVQRWTGKTSAVVRPKSAKMPASIVRAAAKFRLLHGREPSAAELGITQEQLDEWSSGTHFVEVDNADDERPTVELTYDAQEADTQTRMMQLEAAWSKALEDMSPRNRDIADRVLMRGEATASVAESYGLTHGRVMQICKRIETRLKRALNPSAYDPAEDPDRLRAMKERLRYAAAETPSYAAKKRSSARFVEAAA